jgi:acetyltransferase
MATPFGGPIYPINPKHSNVLGIKAYKSISDAPDGVDLAVIITPARTVPGLVKECGTCGVKAVIIISAGFKEVGAEGVKLEKEVLANAREAGLRIIGPNCLGTLYTHTGANPSFGGVMPNRGPVAVISQSGALGCAILDWSIDRGIGLSAFVSIGSMLDIDWGDMIHWLGDDPNTNSIAIYMETIGNPSSFLQAATKVARKKPIIVIKVGRTAAAAKAAASHTGSMTGSDDVLDAAFKRAGVVRVDTMDEFYDLIAAMEKQPLPQGDNLAIITNAGGPGVLATDTLESTGAKLAPISEETIHKLSEVLPSAWSHNNPIDILGDAPADRYEKALAIASKEKNADGFLVLLTPQSVTEPTKTAKLLSKYAVDGKPVYASWMGGKLVDKGIGALNQAGIPTYPQSDMATRAFSYLCHYRKQLKALYPENANADEKLGEEPDRKAAAALIERIRNDQRTLLTEVESKELLEAYRIPTTPIEIAETPEAAAQVAEQMGFPVVIKIHSTTITHKTDVGGVKLNIRDADAVKQAFDEIKTSVAEKVGAEGFEGVTVQPMMSLDGYEIILGSSMDVQFGPVMLFGMGGSLVEVFRDRALGLPPLTRNLSRLMLQETKIFTALKGVRGKKSCDIAALEKLMVRYSQMLVEQQWIKESDLNPVIASETQLIALDARVVLHDPDTPEDQLSHSVIAGK